MNLVLRAARAYWRLNEKAWMQVRRATMPLLVVIGLASVAAWVVGVQTGNTALMWAPVVYTGTMAAGVAVARA